MILLVGACRFSRSFLERNLKSKSNFEVARYSRSFPNLKSKSNFEVYVGIVYRLCKVPDLQALPCFGFFGEKAKTCWIICICNKLYKLQVKSVILIFGKV